MVTIGKLKAVLRNSGAMYFVFCSNLLVIWDNYWGTIISEPTLAHHMAREDCRTHATGILDMVT